MKIRMFCPLCVYKTGQVTSIKLTINNSNFYTVECPYGHKSKIRVQEQKFEVLFDVATSALMDGYYGEAVFGYSTTLERFYEYCIKVLILDSGNDISEFNKTWKLIQNQSERQIGAFFFLYLKKFNIKPPDFEKYKEFRNKVIHKGYFPTEEEVIEFGEAVLQHIFRILIELRKNAQDGITKSFFDKPAENSAQHSCSIPTIIHSSLADELFGKSTLEQELERLRKTGNKYIIK